MTVPTGAYSKKSHKKSKWKHDEKLVASLTFALNGFGRVIDIGAGAGNYVKALRDIGFDVIGVDGTEGIEALTSGLVHQCELTDSNSPETILNSYGTFGAAICIEVGEHIPAGFVDVFVDNICRLPERRLVVSWAIPGQKGRGHVSCRTAAWVATQIEKRSFAYNEEATLGARDEAAKLGRIGKSKSRNLLVFDKIGT